MMIIQQCLNVQKLKVVVSCVVMDVIFSAVSVMYDGHAGCCRSVEQRLRSFNLLESGQHQYFTSVVYRYGGIQDDHIPFVQKGRSHCSVL